MWLSSSVSPAPEARTPILATLLMAPVVWSLLDAEHALFAIPVGPGRVVNMNWLAAARGNFWMPQTSFPMLIAPSEVRYAARSVPVLVEQRSHNRAGKRYMTPGQKPWSIRERVSIRLKMLGSSREWYRARYAEPTTRLTGVVRVHAKLLASTSQHVGRSWFNTRIPEGDRQ
jgi:hypothetical protein